jgi:putative ABC transport system substrate-binding protein
MMQRRAFLVALAASQTLAAARGVLAADASRRYRVGWLVYGGSRLSPIDQTLIDAMALRGLVDGQSIEVTFRYAEGRPERLVSLAAQLAHRKPDVLIGIGGDIIKALYEASGGLPVVGGVSDDPVRAGLAASLARPARNFTGVTFITDEMAAKRLELLREAVPGIKRVAVVWNPQHLDDEMAHARRAAAVMGLELTSHEAQDAEGIDAALHDAAASDADGLFVIPSRLTSLAARKIAAFAIDRRLPAVTAWRELAEFGFLVTYGPNRKDQARQLAGYVERVLKGAKPADLPIERPTTFELAVNLRAAKALGIVLPQPILLRADVVIE